MKSSKSMKQNKLSTKHHHQIITKNLKNMSEIRVIKSVSQQNPAVKSISDHKSVTSKQKVISNQLIIDFDQNENNPLSSNNKLKSSENISPKTNGAGQVQTIRKCLRKGSRICYTDMENITVLRKIPEKGTSNISFVSKPDDAFEKVDSYRSGESLFKTFTFEQTRDIDDPETVKCIEFWKSVMKKNLAPIKCTLLESNKKQTKKKKERTSLSRNKTAENGKSEEKTEKLNFTSDGARIWSEALKEIRKKKLDQLKLYVRERCQYCTDPFTKDLKEQLGFESAEDVQTQIVSLNSWKPVDEQIDLVDNFRKPSLRRRISVKANKMSTTQTVETRMNEKPNADQTGRAASTVSKTKITIPAEVVPTSDTPYDEQGPPKKPPSILKSSSKLGQQRSTTVGGQKSSGPKMSSVEVQAPNIKCPCESDTCVCPHRAAARNSRTSFVEIARQTMLQHDASTEKFFPEGDEPCICENFVPQPWLEIVCSSEPCPAKLPKVEVLESSSDFQLSRILGKAEEEICVCTKKFDVVCPSESCKNKISQGSLIEGFPDAKHDEKDFCVCTNSDSEAPCTSDVCPTKAPEEFLSTSCVCASNLPWSQATCQSWKCSYRRKIKLRHDEEEKIKFRGHPPIREVTSTCMCQQKIPWNDVTCNCEVCTARPRADSILKVKDKKVNMLKTTIQSKTNSNEIIFGRRSKEKLTSVTSLEKLNKEKEKAKPRITTAAEANDCVCSAAPPWKVISCNKKCVAKGSSEKNRTNSLLTSVDRISVIKEEECICKDENLEPTCKFHKCRNKEVSIEYPPCICPKDLEEGKHEHFQCVSETCKMKKIDKTCLCRLQTDAPCDAKTCSSKPQASKTLKQSKKPLRYDPKCICKVRGLSTTQEVSCVVPECPFKKKQPKVVKMKTPKLFVPPSHEYRSSSEETLTKCICGTKDLSVSVKCGSLSCKRKNKSGKSEHGDDYYDEDNSEQELCICKNEQSDFGIEEEVICNQIQCPKIHVAEDGAVMNDKCVCANLDQACDEPTCPSSDENHNKICSEMVHKSERPYCYICGHFDCVSTNKQTARKKICEEIYTDTNVM